MKIPVNETTGYSTVSATQLRRYGAGGFRLSEQEEARGCPRQYKAHYVDHVVQQGFSYPLAYGRLIHDCFYRMEEDGLTPQEALDLCFPPELDPAAYREALTDLTNYMERGASPTDLYGTVAVETDLFGLLYVDEEFGPIWYRGIIDWLGVDLNDPTVMHAVDYKTNRNPPSVDDVRGDVQLKGYDWLIRQNWEKFMPKGSRPAVVQHLDAIKWREIEVRFDDEDIEDWHSWAVAVVGQILRDETAEPVLNPGCAWCPVQSDCPAWLGLPSLGEAVAAEAADGDVSEMTDVERLAWRDSANSIRLLLEKAVKAVDEEFEARARTQRVEVGDSVFVVEPQWADRIDLRQLHRALGSDTFYAVVTAAKTKIKAATQNWPPDRVASVQQAFQRVPIGSKVVRKKREDAS